jgi:hypothetical protein
MRRAILFVFLGLMLCACHSGSGKDVPPFQHQAFYEELKGYAEEFLFVDGDWKGDFDDGAFYGPAFYAQAGETEDDDAFRQRAQEAYQDNLGVVRAVENLTEADVNDLAMSLLGMIEYVDATGDRSELDEIDEMIQNINDFVESAGHYLPPEMVPGYAMDTYGPTAINGLMGLISLQRAEVLGGAGTDQMVEFARGVADKIEEYNWSGTYYKFDPDTDRLHLYPNVTMIIYNARLHQLTKKPGYKGRAVETYLGMQPLKVTEADGLAAPGRYRSPYSQEDMGAQTDDYSTLSSQNYLMFALMLLYQITGEDKYLEEMNPVLDFLQENLVGQACLVDISQDHLCDPACSAGQACLKGDCFADECHTGILHHWMDGRVAEADDLEFFCSGCNLQTLYLMWYRQEKL